MEEPPKKYFRLFPGNEVRLMNAYFVTCDSFEKDENGNVTVSPLYLRSGVPRRQAASDGRKVKGTIHWVSGSACAVDAEVSLYENIDGRGERVYTMRTEV